jgi:protein ImuB
VVAVDPPDGLMIEAGGVAHLHGGEEAMLADLVGRLGHAGIAARAAMAATHGAAHALARHAARPILTVDNEATPGALLDLPIAALRLPADLVAALKHLGFRRIGELAAQPRAPLTLRFGPEPGRRLDQAFGRAAEPAILLTSPELLLSRRVFAEPIGAAETLAHAAGALIRALCTTLEAKGQGVRCLDLLFYRVDHRIEAIRVRTARPVRDTKRLTRLLCDRLETVDPGFGVERMTLTATITEPLAYRPATTALGEASEPDISGLIDTLVGRVGAKRLFRFAAVESDLPERSVRRTAPLADATTGRWSLRWPRPVRLLPTPEPIETVALLPDHPPASFTWRGSRRRIRRGDGPERVFGEWGRSDVELTAVRDYFQVETEAGERFWLFREGGSEDPATGPQRWFLHGIFA